MIKSLVLLIQFYLLPTLKTNETATFESDVSKSQDVVC